VQVSQVRRQSITTLIKNLIAVAERVHQGDFVLKLGSGNKAGGTRPRQSVSSITVAQSIDFLPTA
jgi:hypothetical protein